MTHEVAEQVVHIPVEEIFSDNEFNCRGDITPFDVLELAKNIAENGLAQPIVVQPYDKCPNPKQKYRIVMGHRRYMAHVVNKSDTIESIVREGLNDQVAFTMNVVENIHRKDLNILEEARALNRYRMWGFTQAQTSEAIRKSKGWVQVRFTLLDLPIQIQEEAAAGLLTTEQIKHLGGLSRDDQFELVRRIKDSKAKGEGFKIKRKYKKKIDPHEKKARTKESMETMQDVIYDGIGPCAFTRALAWATGHISTLDLLTDVKQYADDIGKPFIIPAHLMEPNLVPDHLKED
jgi:ParB/RepB/Spo0J family partition protein